MINPDGTGTLEAIAEAINATGGESVELSELRAVAEAAGIPANESRVDLMRLLAWLTTNTAKG